MKNPVGDSRRVRGVRVWRVRPGITISLSPVDRHRVEALVRDRNTAQKHVWRAEIVLLSAEGIGTNEIICRTGKSKTCVWRCQERFAEEGYEGLLRTTGGTSPGIGSRRLPNRWGRGGSHQHAIDL